MEPYDCVNRHVVPCRALENKVTVAYANWAAFTSSEGVAFNGESSVCGPEGRVLVVAGKEPAVIVAEVGGGSSGGGGVGGGGDSGGGGGGRGGGGDGGGGRKEGDDSGKEVLLEIDLSSDD